MIKRRNNRYQAVSNNETVVVNDLAIERMLGLYDEKDEREENLNKGKAQRMHDKREDALKISKLKTENRHLRNEKLQLKRVNQRHIFHIMTLKANQTLTNNSQQQTTHNDHVQYNNHDNLAKRNKELCQVFHIQCRMGSRLGFFVLPVFKHFMGIEYIKIMSTFLFCPTIKGALYVMIV